MSKRELIAEIREKISTANMPDSVWAKMPDSVWAKMPDSVWANMPDSVWVKKILDDLSDSVLESIKESLSN